MKYLQLSAILALFIGSISSTSAADVHTDQYVSETLGSEILPSSSSDSNVNPSGEKSLNSANAFESLDYGSPSSALDDPISISTESLIAAEPVSGEAPEFY